MEMRIVGEAAGNRLINSIKRRNGIIWVKIIFEYRTRSLMISFVVELSSTREDSEVKIKFLLKSLLLLLLLSYLDESRIRCSKKDEIFQKLLCADGKYLL